MTQLRTQETGDIMQEILSLCLITEVPQGEDWNPLSFHIYLPNLVEDEQRVILYHCEGQNTSRNSWEDHTVREGKCESISEALSARGDPL